MRYLSVCSGIEAATVAWEPLGFVPAAFAEIARFPSRVLAHHWPYVPNLGDLAAIDAGALGPVDLLVGGTPCQAFSVAGRRASLADRRGNLTLAFADLFHALVDQAGARWALWENVPGVLSLADNAFGCFLGRLVGGNDALPFPRGVERWPDAGMVAGPRARAAWRILDAQYFGLAQRRRRVFVVVGAGERADPAAVLFERQGLRRHPPPRGEAGADVAGCLAPGSGGGCGPDDNDARAGHLIAFGGNDTRGPIDVATALNAHGGPCGRQDFESETFVVAPPLTSNPYGDHESREGLPVAFDTTQITSRKNRSHPQPGDPCHPLAAGAHPPAIAFDCKAGGETSFSVGPVAGALRGEGHGDGHAAVSFQCRGSNIDLGQDITGTLTGNIDRAAGAPCLAAPQGPAWAVRRLMPVECERLQGFPDGHTAVPGAADGPRYMALGNSKAVPVVRWIGRRLQAEEAA